MKKSIATALLILIASPGTSGLAAARQLDLDAWVDTQLIPYTSRELRQHPRFRNQSIQLVVLRDESPQSAGSELAIDIRDRLRDALNAVPGIRILWAAGQSGIGIADTAAYPNCSGMQPDYLLGIELNERRRGDISVAVLALDLADQRRVPGFGKTWEGPLSATQMRQYRTRAVDPDFRGERNAPWDSNELDLMAAHLARARRKRAGQPKS